MISPRSAAAEESAARFRSYHETALREEARRRLARTGIVVLICILGLGIFAPSPISYYVGVIVTVVFGFIARRSGS
jgi:fatty acid desaturase